MSLTTMARETNEQIYFRAENLVRLTLPYSTTIFFQKGFVQYEDVTIVTVGYYEGSMSCSKEVRISKDSKGNTQEHVSDAVCFS